MVLDAGTAVVAPLLLCQKAIVDTAAEGHFMSPTGVSRGSDIKVV